jgi:hypothetical protein
MLRKISASASSGWLVLASLALPATPAQSASAITEFSSQQGVDPRFKAVPRAPAGVPRNFGAAPRNFGVAPRNFGVAPRNFGVAPRNFGAAPRNFGAPRNFQGPGGPAVGFRGPAVGFRGPAVGFRGPVGVTTFRGGRAAFIRGPHRFFRNGAYIPFVALGALGAIAIGSRYYTPYAYVDGPGPDACMGPTDDGMCELRMTEVPLEDGTAVMQCVSYCPQ